jgi:hypothetical protein
MADRPHIFRALVTFFRDDILPDVLGLLEDGIEYRRLLDRRTRREARDVVEHLHGIVWGELLADNTDDVTEGVEIEDVLFVTPIDLARRAGKDPSYVRRLCRHGVLPSRKVRGRHFIERDAADRWLGTRN